MLVGSSHTSDGDSKDADTDRLDVHRASSHKRNRAGLPRGVRMQGG